MRTVTLNGIQYTRNVELLGDVEKVSWHSPIGEMFDNESLEELETIYENICLSEITPALPII